MSSRAAHADKNHVESRLSKKRRPIGKKREAVFVQDCHNDVCALLGKLTIPYPKSEILIMNYALHISKRAPFLASVAGGVHPGFRRGRGHCPHHHHHSHPLPHLAMQVRLLVVTLWVTLYEVSFCRSKPRTNMTVFCPHQRVELHLSRKRPRVLKSHYSVKNSGTAGLSSS